MKKSLHTVTICILALAVLLAGCAQPGAVVATPYPSPTTPAPEITRAAPPPEAAADLPALVAGNTDFALDLYRILSEQEDGNLFFSPHSLSTALAMTYLGARGETERQMAGTLHYTLPQERLHPAFNALNRALEPGEDHSGEGAFRLNVANALWGQQGFPFRPEFFATLEQQYGAPLEQADFVNETPREAARQGINGWVDAQTEGKIPELLAQGILTELTRLVLVNAIYFKGEWMIPFRNGTQDAPFYRLDGSQVQVPTMSRRADAPYAEGPDYQAVELPYKGDQITMLVLLPAEGQLEAFERSLDAGRVSQILKALETRDLKLYLPRFSYRSEFLLEKTLPSIGMVDAFDPIKADLTGMYDRSQAGANLYLSHVVHQAFVAVDEEGTKAAAATAVIAEIESMPAEMRVDRPFLFLIHDRETGAILFLGRCLDPSAE